jgi:hypothetical protein
MTRSAPRSRRAARWSPVDVFGDRYLRSASCGPHTHDLRAMSANLRGHLRGTQDALPECDPPSSPTQGPHMSKKNPRAAFTPIDRPELTAVTGGRRSSSSSSGNDDRILDSLNSLENSIRDIGRNQNQQPDPMSQMMPFLMMSMMNQQPAAAPVAPPPPQVICIGRRRC